MAGSSRERRSELMRHASPFVISALCSSLFITGGMLISEKSDAMRLHRSYFDGMKYSWLGSGDFVVGKPEVVVIPAEAEASGAAVTVPPKAATSKNERNHQQTDSPGTVHRPRGFVNGPVDLTVLSKHIPQCALDLPKPKTFIFIMSSHTGSTSIMSQIIRHPDIYWPNIPSMEPLNRPQIRDNATAMVEFTTNFFDEGVRAGKLVGFKMNIVPILWNPKEWGEIFRRFNTRIIWNYRHNMIKRSIGRYPFTFFNDSTSVAGVAANMSHEQRCSMGVGCSFAVDPMNLHCLLLRSLEVENSMNQGIDLVTTEAGVERCVLEVPYDDYLHHPDEVVIQMEQFIHVRPYLVPSTRGKATSDNICEVVDNMAELCASFAECSQWGWMLEDRKYGCSCANFTYESKGGDGVNPYCGIKPLRRQDPRCVG